MAKILICDDEAALWAVIKRYTTFEGHEVMEQDFNSRMAAPRVDSKYFA